MAVWLLAHLHVGNRITALFDVGNLRGGVLRGAVQHGDRYHRGQAPGHSAGVKEIEADLVSSPFGQIARFMPRIDGGAIGRDRKSTRLNSSHGYISYAV